MPQDSAATGDPGGDVRKAVSAHPCWPRRQRRTELPRVLFADPPQANADASVVAILLAERREGWCDHSERGTGRPPPICPLLLPWTIGVSRASRSLRSRVSIGAVRPSKAGCSAIDGAG